MTQVDVFTYCVVLCMQYLVKLTLLKQVYIRIQKFCPYEDSLSFMPKTTVQSFVPINVHLGFAFLV